MGYEFWYDVAEYLNEANRGKFTSREIAINAYEYTCDWWASNDTTDYVGNIVEEVIALLEEDGSEKAKEFLDEINYQIDNLGLMRR